MEEKRNETATTSSGPALEIRLLGTFQMKLHQQAVLGFRSDKARALLAYLVVEFGRSSPPRCVGVLVMG